MNNFYKNQNNFINKVDKYTYDHVEKNLNPSMIIKQDDHVGNFECPKCHKLLKASQDEFGSTECIECETAFCK